MSSFKESSFLFMHEQRANRPSAISTIPAAVSLPNTTNNNNTPTSPTVAAKVQSVSSSSSSSSSSSMQHMAPDKAEVFAKIERLAGARTAREILNPAHRQFLRDSRLKVAIKDKLVARQAAYHFCFLFTDVLIIIEDSNKSKLNHIITDEPRYTPLYIAFTSNDPISTAVDYQFGLGKIKNLMNTDSDMGCQFRLSSAYKGVGPKDILNRVVFEFTANSVEERMDWERDIDALLKAQMKVKKQAKDEGETYMDLDHLEPARISCDRNLQASRKEHTRLTAELQQKERKMAQLEAKLRHLQNELDKVYNAHEATKAAIAEHERSSSTLLSTIRSSSFHDDIRADEENLKECDYILLKVVFKGDTEAFVDLFGTEPTWQHEDWANASAEAVQQRNTASQNFLNMIKKQHQLQKQQQQQDPTTTTSATATATTNGNHDKDKDSITSMTSSASSSIAAAATTAEQLPKPPLHQQQQQQQQLVPPPVPERKPSHAMPRPPVTIIPVMSMSAAAAAAAATSPSHANAVPTSPRSASNSFIGKINPLRKF